ncbi:MAG TPA: molybdopterin-binding protein [Hyphomicrobium sp.]|nr:molybdopterin-binding protein [Hyphomicrobium sp.]
MATPDDVTAALLVIGDEILSGRTKDKNIGAVADRMTEVGIRLREVRIVADDEADIIGAVNALRARYTYVFTTGGIGPTHDDITADSMAKAFGVSIDVDPRARAVMQAACDSRGLELTPARLRMARIPEGAELVEIPVSIAPGFVLGNVIVMAGIPEIMQVMLDAVTPRLQKGARMLSESLRLQRPESAIADIFAEHQRCYPDVAMGSYPAMREGKPTVDLVLRATDPARLAEAMATLRAKLVRLPG